MDDSGSDATTERVWSHCGHWKQFRAHLCDPQSSSACLQGGEDDEDEAVGTGSSHRARSRWAPRRDSWGSSSTRSRTQRTRCTGSRRSLRRTRGPRANGAAAAPAEGAQAAGATARRALCTSSGTAPRASPLRASSAACAEANSRGASTRQAMSELAVKDSNWLGRAVYALVSTVKRCRQSIEVQERDTLFFRRSIHAEKEDRRFQRQQSSRRRRVDMLHGRERTEGGAA